MNAEGDRSPEVLKHGLSYRYKYFYEDPRLLTRLEQPQCLRHLDEIAMEAEYIGNRRAKQVQQDEHTLVVFEFNSRIGLFITPASLLVRTTACMFDWLAADGLEDITVDHVELMTLLYGKQQGEPEDQTKRAWEIDLDLHEARHFNPNDQVW